MASNSKQHRTIGDEDQFGKSARLRLDAETRPIIDDLFDLLTKHNVPLTDDLHVAARDLAIDAVYTRRDHISDRGTEA